MNPFRSRSSPAKSRSQKGVPPPPIPPRDSASDDEIPSTSVRTERLQALARLASTLSDLKSTAKLPPSLTFQPGATATAPKLAFEPNNAPFLAHEDALVKLLTQLDGVQSEGDQVVREQRKKIVRQVEAELARLDEIRKAEFERVQRGDPPATGGGEETMAAATMPRNGLQPERKQIPSDSRGRATRSQQRERREGSDKPSPVGPPMHGAKAKADQQFSHRLAEHILENEHGKRQNHSRGRGSPHSGSEDWSESRPQAREPWFESPSQDRYSKMSRREDCTDHRTPPFPQLPLPPPIASSSRPVKDGGAGNSVPFFSSLPSRFDQRR